MSAPVRRRIAVVTGASRGIGRSVALALAARGVDVALVARDEAKLRAVESEIRAAYPAARVCVARTDVAQRVDVDALHAQVLRELGTPDLLLHCAGIVRRLRIEQMTDADWDDVIGANLRALFLVTRAFLGDMRASHAPGRIVVVGSISATMGTATLTSYCASKWGAMGFVKALAEELRGTPLQVLCVNPGSVDTEMLAGSGFAPQMTADEVASTLVYVALDAPPQMQGSCIDLFGA